MGYRRELAREVGGEVHAFELLTEAEAREMIELFRAARANEVRALRRAIDAALVAMPAPLRKMTRKIIFGR
ncbi:hypothetical protein AB0G00_26625 [Nocardia salmonicida]|uniref:hypothetical protein n=1 Tax=Nocardia TaxID=1817 RepID=UPI00265B0693|nr:hypothetical protein [Nocardia sp. PE-7]WKG08605.1 hypothetical protein QX204_26720 [Nocardia sp. PE-7]